MTMTMNPASLHAHNRLAKPRTAIPSPTTARASQTIVLSCSPRSFSCHPTTPESITSPNPSGKGAMSIPGPPYPPHDQTFHPFVNSSLSLRDPLPEKTIELAGQGDVKKGQELQRARHSQSESKPIPVTARTSGILNLWQPTPMAMTLHRMTPMAAYDINTKLPFRILETDQVRLEPLVPAKHLAGFMSLPKESWDVLGDMGPFPTEESALISIEAFRKDPRSLLLAVVDKQREAKGLSCFAGVYGLIEYNRHAGTLADGLNILFGCTNIHPTYFRTHVNSHAMYLVLRFLFDEVKLVRVQYDAVTFNERSIKAALRFGFREEGVCRNLNGFVPEHKKRPGERDRRSQDLWLSSMTDMEWEKDGRERLEGMVARVSVDTTVL